MSAISLKSITGITSITTPAGVDNQLTLHTNNTTERVKINSSGNVSIANDLDVDGHTNLDNLSVAGISTFSKNIILPDSTDTTDGRVKFGASTDMQIFHYSGANYIDVTSTLNIRGPSSGATINIKPKSAEDGIKIIPDGAVELYHNNTLRLETRTNDVKFHGGLVAVDNVKLQLGSSGDLQLFHDGYHSYVSDPIGIGNLRIRVNTGQVELQPKIGEYGLICKPAGAVELYFDNSLKFKTDSIGCEIAGALIIPDGSASSNRISVGNAGDLKIYHDGSNSRIENSTGSLVLNSRVLIKTADNSESIATFNENGGVELYHDNSKKFETTSSGCRLGDSVRLSLGTSDDFQLDHDGTDNRILNQNNKDFVIFSNAATALSISGTTGDISIPGSSNRNLLWDKSDGCLEFADNAKAKFGASSDLEIYHDGSTNIINGLYHPIELRHQSEVHVKCVDDGATELYHNNVKSLETTGDGGVKAQGNYIVGTSGRGLQFNASDSGSSEILDDYEQGTFTPQLNGMGSVTYDARSGRYTKIGNVCYFQIRININSRTGGNHAHITNMPFTADHSTITYPHCTFFAIEDVDLGGDRHPVAQFQNSEIYLYSVGYESSANYSAIDENQIKNSSQWGVFGFYFTT